LGNFDGVLDNGEYVGQNNVLHRNYAVTQIRDKSHR